MRFYFDTSIWLDFYEKRGKNGGVALKLIKKIIEKDWMILYSDLTLRELKKLYYSLDEINNMFNIVKPRNLRKIHIYKEENEESIKLSYLRKVPRGDALHAIVARDNDVYFISRDYHFNKLKDITIPKLPEDFI